MRPEVVLHVQMSVDGRLDFLDEDMGRYYGLAATLECDAMLSGSRTMLAAYPDPSDTPLVGAEKASDLRLVVVDSGGKIPNWRRIQSEPWWSDCIVLCSASTPETYVKHVGRLGVGIVRTSGQAVDLAAGLRKLREQYEIRRIRVDSGGVLNGVLLRRRLVDEVSVLVDPRLVGGTSPRSIFQAADLRSASDVTHLRLTSAEPLENGFVWLRYDVRQP